MSGFVIGRDEAGRNAHFDRIAAKIPAMAQQPREQTLERLTGAGWLIGSPDQIVDALGRREEAGISRTMLQHHANNDFDSAELIASEVIPQVQR
jgi:alkanesulfonate monooxygenase SsuD/methylene tetrahydromethanopterin reductase-like flavin-dependent oxidoreductase (luciferase family)